jgi:peptidyl-dipeptidase A
MICSPTTVIAFGAALALCTASSVLANDVPNEAEVAQKAQAEFVALRDAYLARYKPLFLTSSNAWWAASISGKDEDFAKKKKADTDVLELHSDHEFFNKIEALRKSEEVRDPSSARQLDVMYFQFLPAQANQTLQKKILDIENKVEQVFNTHRSEVHGKNITENDVRKILKDSADSDEAKQAWMGYTSVGNKIAPDLKAAVGYRNQIAKELGFDNYYDMKLTIQEIDKQAFVELFDELDALTREPFAKIKSEIDDRMAKKFGVANDQLRPWHFGDLFFQEAPGMESVNLDDLFADVDMIALTKKYYDSLGMPCDDIIERSDLYEREGKSPHAFCTHIDREGDVRVLCNLKPNMYWADTLMHEVGHGVYDKYIDRELPWLLREPSHSITTEGAAMMFGALVKSEDWLINVRGLPKEEAKQAVEAAQASLRIEKLIFSRWTQVMVRFEMAMYANPDQDLSKLWWDLKKKYQLMNPPDDLTLPGYAAKIHVLSVPVYYHSYMMGDLFAAQVHAFAAQKVLNIKNPDKTCFYNQPKAGEYFRDKVFGPGNLMSWNELTKFATGEYLSAKYFAKRFIN